MPHPAVTLANLARIDAASPFTLFREGMSAATERVVVAIDNERGLAVLEQLARHLGAPVPVTTATVTALSATTATDLRAGTAVRAKALPATVVKLG